MNRLLAAASAAALSLSLAAPAEAAQTWGPPRVLFRAGALDSNPSNGFVYLRIGEQLRGRNSLDRTDRRVRVRPTPVSVKNTTGLPVGFKAELRLADDGGVETTQTLRFRVPAHLTRRVPWTPGAAVLEAGARGRFVFSRRDVVPASPWVRVAKRVWESRFAR